MTDEKDKLNDDPQVVEDSQGNEDEQDQYTGPAPADTDPTGGDPQGPGKGGGG